MSVYKSRQTDGWSRSASLPCDDEGIPDRDGSGHERFPVDIYATPQKSLLNKIWYSDNPRLLLTMLSERQASPLLCLECGSSLAYGSDCRSLSVTFRLFFKSLVVGIRGNFRSFGEKRNIIVFCYCLLLSYPIETGFFFGLKCILARCRYVICSRVCCCSWLYA